MGVLLALMTGIGLLYCEAPMSAWMGQWCWTKDRPTVGWDYLYLGFFAVFAVCWLLALTRLLPLTMLPILFVSEFVQWNLGL